MSITNEVLKLLVEKFDWNLNSTLTSTGKKLVSDTIKALAILQDNNFKWICVEDELPNQKEYDWVLVIAKMVPEGYYGVPAVAELRRGIWYFRDEEKPAEETLGIKVTHWMPLPPKP